MAAVIRRGYPTAHCGAVLITDRHVLTAAHCTQKMRIDDLYVRLGEYNFRTYNESRARDFRVVDVRQHVDFDPTTYENDICVLKLHQAALFNSYIWPVCMPPGGETWEGWMGIVTGWGTQFFGGPTSEVLMEVTLPIWSQENCRNAFTHRIVDTVVCAGAPEGGRDSCQVNKINQSMTVWEKLNVYLSYYFGEGRQRRAPIGSITQPSMDCCWNCIVGRSMR